MLIALFGAAAAFVAATSAVIWLVGSRAAAPGARLAQFSYERTTQEEASFRARVVKPAVGTVLQPLVALLPHALVRRASQDLTAARSSLTVQRFFAVVGITALLFPAFTFLILRSSGASPALSVVLTIMAALVGFLLPFWLIRRRVQRRRQAIWKNLPDAFDLITVSVEAGLGLDAALRQVSQKLSGPFSDELAHTLREVGVGRPRREALEAMAARIGVREVTTFLHAVVQTEQLGTSLGRTLRAQGTSIRTRRRQKAEELARKAPVKMVFPLVLFIMPSFFIVTIGPTVVRLISYLHGG